MGGLRNRYDDVRENEGGGETACNNGLRASKESGGGGSRRWCGLVLVSFKAVGPDGEAGGADISLCMVLGAVIMTRDGAGKGPLAR